MKKRIIMSAAVLVMLMLVLIACAGENKENSDKTSYEPKKTPEKAQTEVQNKMPEGPDVYINSEKTQKPSEYSGSAVMVSAQELADRLGAEYKYNAEKQKIKLKFDRFKISMKIGSRRAKCPDKEIKIKPPYINNSGDVMIPAVKAARALGAGTMKLDGDLYITPFAGIDDIPKGYNVPVLMYHAVGDNTFGIEELFVSPDNMEAQLKYLTENGYTTITFEDLYRIDKIKKPVMLTFDDGYDNNYEILFPLLKKYNCKATIFVITHSLEKGVDPSATHKMTAKQIKKMSDSGLVSIQSHTVMHYNLSELTKSEQEKQLKASRRQLLKLTGKQPFVLCYPIGGYNNDTLDIAPKYYRYGIKINGGMYNTSDSSFLVNRYYISRNTDIGTFAGYID